MFDSIDFRLRELRFINSEIGGIMIGKLLAGVVGAVVIGLLGSLLTKFAVPESLADGKTVTYVALVGFAGIAFLLAMTAERGAKAWRRVFVLMALLCFAMPLTAVLFTGAQISAIGTETSNDSAAIAGTAIGGGMISMVSGFVGFFLGVIFLIVGLMIGRDKQVVVVER